MNVIDLARICQDCRNARQEYLRTRSMSALNKSTKLETKLDHCVAIILDGQKTLFEDSSPRGAGTTP